MKNLEIIKKQARLLCEIDSLINKANENKKDTKRNKNRTS